MSNADDLNDELLDYEEDEVATQVETEKKKGGYTGVHTAGFKDFLLKGELLRAITDCGFEHPSEVQHQAIPDSIHGMDVLCQAKSGLGKTAVFVLSTLQQINDDSEDTDVACVVLAHTRELAHQIHHEFERFSQYLDNVKCSVIIGGMPVKDQTKKIKEDKPRIIVATPGRLIDLVKQKAISLSKVKHFVVDECDKMLDQVDMRKQVQDVFKACPSDKQVMMFSATLDKEIRAICKKFMSDPKEVLVDSESKLTLHGLVQHYTMVDEKEKNKKLMDLLDALDFNQVVIFVKNHDRCVALNKLLVDCQFPSICIHGGLPQQERLDRYDAFKKTLKRILVTTDMCARGIDIERVNIVINYDMPETSEKKGNGADTYLHRVGRAGRFGTKGLAITFVTTEEDSNILNEVQNRFDVDIKELPETIDSSTYLPNAE